MGTSNKFSFNISHIVSIWSGERCHQANTSAANSNVSFLFGLIVQLTKISLIFFFLRILLDDTKVEEDGILLYNGLLP